jgi:hypothetical protein
MALIPHRRWERTSRKQHRAGGTKGMVKARVARAIELLEDIVRAPRPTSSEALPWRHPFALSHFLEGVQDDARKRTPSKLCPRQGVAERQARPSPFAGKEKMKASPLAGREACERRLIP